MPLSSSFQLSPSFSLLLNRIIHHRPDVSQYTLPNTIRHKIVLLSLVYTSWVVLECFTCKTHPHLAARAFPKQKTRWVPVTASQREDLIGDLTGTNGFETKAVLNSN
jgi:hypothetical protein